MLPRDSLNMDRQRDQHKKGLDFLRGTGQVGKELFNDKLWEMAKQNLFLYLFTLTNHLQYAEIS